MKLFLDTANLDEIKEAVSLGIISGITTNPALIAREGTRDVKERIREIVSLVDGTIIAEVLGTEAEVMISEGRKIASWHPNMAVKVPMTLEGIKAASVLSKEGIKVVVTIIFTVSQAILAAMAGAAYVAPFMGRSRLIGHDGMKLTEDIVKIFKTQGIQTEVIGASIETPIDVVEAAKAGAQVITAPLKTIKQMAAHPNTDITLKEFLTGWDNIKIV